MACALEILTAAKTLNSLGSIRESFTYTSKDKELWLGSGQNGFGIHNIIMVLWGRSCVETD